MTGWMEVDPVSGMTPAEVDAMNVLAEIASAGVDGSALLVKIAADLDKMIQEAGFPALTSQWLGDLGDGTWGLMCPVCNEWVDHGTLYAVDRAERWTRVHEIEGIPDAAPGETLGVVTFLFDDRGEFGDTLYLLHEIDGQKPHPVQLASNWESI